MAEESVLGGAGSFIGNSVGEAAAFAAGLAIGPLLRPILQALENETWSLYPDKPLDPQTMALAVAQGRIDQPTAAAEAALTGIGATAFSNLVNFAITYPGAAQLLDLQRRTILPAGDLVAALQRHGLTAEYAGYVAELIDNPLDPAVIATAIQRSIIEAPFDLPVAAPTATGNVKAFPTSGIDAKQEAAWSGIDLDRLEVMTAIVGLPMSLQEAASGYFRGILTIDDYYRAVAEGDTRNEWRDVILEQARAILSPDQWAELFIRGWVTQAELYAGTAEHGMTTANTDYLAELKGRPIPVHQIVTGLARGGTYTGDAQTVPEPFLKSLQESDIRPEWYGLAYANRYSLPSAFVLKALATAGDLTQAQSETILLQIGWPPDLATSVSTVWAGGTATTAAQKKQTLSHLTAEYLSGALTESALTTALVGLGYTAQQAADEIALAEFNAAKTARTKATNAVGKRYIAAQISEAAATTALEGMGWPAGAVTNFITAWTEERNAQLTTLTVAQVAAALKAGALLASQATPLLQDLGEDAQAITAIIATSGANPAT